MSILETRAPTLPKLWSLPYTVLSTLVAYAQLVSAAFSEARRMQRDAQRRYPQLRW